MTENQSLASDPACSIWVSANAGTGKTKVLTDRALRLLLSGSAPSRILCITYTRAAAAEIQSRIHKQLSCWVTMPPESLVASITSLTGEAPSPQLLVLARTLFARVVDDIQGVRIHTIHAFCQSLLRRFPLESSIPSHFTLIDERTSAELLQEAKLRLFAEKVQEDSALAAAIHALSGNTSEGGFTDLVAEIIRNRRFIISLIVRENGITHLAANIRRLLNMAPATDEQSLFNHYFNYTPSEQNMLEEVINILANAEDMDVRLAKELKQWLDLKENRSSAISAYLRIFLTSQGVAREKLCSSKVRKAYPHVEIVVRKEQQRVEAYNEDRKALNTFNTTAHIITVADVLLAVYEHLKRTRGFLDYDDLILHARNLLQRQNMASWVLYKLDGGLDHILIDEAQDTSALQWDIIQTLVAEFFAGEGSRGIKRTLFVVGDEKQSIYSFQGAEPKEFIRMRQLLAGRINCTAHELRLVSLGLSFRSTEPILKAVDAVFSSQAMKNGLGFSDMEILHEARRSGIAGRVELWPLVVPLAVEKKIPWQLPGVYTFTEKPAHQLANIIASTIAEWIRKKTILKSKGRLLSAGDIMILVQKRNFLVPSLIGALKQHNIPVAGIDRMRLTENIAVMDLMALGHFLLLPEDDLNLAIILKSPLIGLSEDELFLLAYNRGVTSLWQRLKASAFTDASEYLGRLLGMTDFMPVYELYAYILEVTGGRKRFSSRLGDECNDPLDEFMNHALQYERVHPSSLQGFLHWLVMSESEVKRDMEQGRDEVRIMTVHGAKGLQAPIVFLPDTVTMPMSKEKLLWEENREAFFWSSSQKDTPALCQKLKEIRANEAKQEYNRLLYVAMTRAEDELYICGWSNKETINRDCWYGMIQEHFSPVAEKTEKGWVLSSAQIHNARPEAVEKSPKAVHAPLPCYANVPPRTELDFPKPILPAKMQENSAVISPVSGAINFNRGVIIHRLLQYLPELPISGREARGLLYLGKHVPHLEEIEAKKIIAEIMEVMLCGRFSPIFGPGSVAEVAVSGVVELPGGRKQLISGQIDRLLVTDREVFIIDYKTHHIPPMHFEDIPRQYILQMQAYRELIKRIYPARQVECALLWTAGPKLMPLDLSSMAAPLDYIAG